MSNLTPGTQFTGKNFLDSQLVTLSGTVYDDVNGNGIKDLGEPELANIPVTITKPDGSTAIVTTNADGTWTYSNLARGNYSVAVDAPTGVTVERANSAPAGVAFAGRSRPDSHAHAAQ